MFSFVRFLQPFTFRMGKIMTSSSIPSNYIYYHRYSLMFFPTGTMSDLLTCQFIYFFINFWGILPLSKDYNYEVLCR